MRLYVLGVRNRLYCTLYCSKTLGLASTVSNRTKQWSPCRMIWLQFQPKTILFILQELLMNKTLIVNQELILRSYGYKESILPEFMVRV
jgi:hypothetical protein